jgi:iron-sulfur cluster assembly protein
LEPVLNLTEKAAGQVRRRAGDLATQGLRVFVTAGGCSGMQYEMKFAPREEGDLEYDQFGVKLFVDERSAIFLKGSIIDFEDGLTAAGFRIRNPNAKATCGCGTSFEA